MRSRDFRSCCFNRVFAVQEVDGFKYYKLTNLVVLFLPANTTSHIQPLDQGIIAGFKAHYRRYLVNWTISEYDKEENKGVDLRKMKPDFLQMLTWSKKAWDVITEETISNCWWKTGMFPDLPEPLPKKARQARHLAPLNFDDIVVEEEVVTEGPCNRPVGNDYDLGVRIAVKDLAEAIYDLGLAANVHDDDMFEGLDYCFIDGEASSHEYLEDVALVELVMSANAPTLEDSDDDDEPLEAPSTSRGDVARMLENVHEYMQWSDDCNASDVEVLDALRAKLNRTIIARLQQSVIPFARKDRN